MAIQDTHKKTNFFFFQVISLQLMSCEKKWHSKRILPMQLYLWLDPKRRGSLYATWIAKITYFLLLFFIIIKIKCRLGQQEEKYWMQAKLYRLYSEKKSPVNVPIYTLNFHTITLVLLRGWSPRHRLLLITTSELQNSTPETVFFPRIRTLCHRFLGTNFGI